MVLSVEQDTMCNYSGFTEKFVHLTCFKLNSQKALKCKKIAFSDYSLKQFPFIIVAMQSCLGKQKRDKSLLISRVSPLMVSFL